MQLHNLPKFNIKRSQRVGRGGKRGTTSGRGQKGQKSRAGHRMRPAQRDLILRLPKLRGFRNKIKKEKPAVFNLAFLQGKIKSGGGTVVINKDFLKTAGLLPKNHKGGVKILGDGSISAPLTVIGLSVSKNAREKIEKAGGKIV